MSHRSRSSRERGENRSEGSPLAAAVVAVSFGAALMYGLKSLITTPEPALSRDSDGASSEKHSATDPGDSLAAWQRVTRDEVHRSQHEPVRSPREGLECKICMHREVEFVLECGHLLCPVCAVGIIGDSRQCPFDRKDLQQAPKRVFL